MYEELVKELRNMFRAYKATDNENCRHAKTILKAADAIEELSKGRPTGHWIKDRLTSLNGVSYEAYRCSECQSAFYWRMKYCGQCGCRMETGHDV